MKKDSFADYRKNFLIEHKKLKVGRVVTILKITHETKKGSK